MNEPAVNTGDRPLTAEERRLVEDRERKANWKRWGTYLSERQWATVREDYSADGDVWRSFTHDMSRSRAYRWGEDGLLGLTDRECRLCIAPAMWNGNDPILKERLFGLGSHEGNHGEDVKECYYYLDATPTHSYAKGLYKYPHKEYPYAALLEENRRRGLDNPEYELGDTGIFKEERYFDILIEYAKASPNDVLIRYTIINRGPDPAAIDFLPVVWFRNAWSWEQLDKEGHYAKPWIASIDANRLHLWHETLGDMTVVTSAPEEEADHGWLFTENETNTERLYKTPPVEHGVKDAFHDRVVNDEPRFLNKEPHGTKAARWYHWEIPPGEKREVRVRFSPESEMPFDALGPVFDDIFRQRIDEANEFYTVHIPSQTTEDERSVVRQAYAGLLWTKQYYHYVIEEWLAGDPGEPPPPDQRYRGRNRQWQFLFNRDVLSMPDKWEYPWYASWDTAFHMLPFARIDPDFAKDQLILFLREWYMHPNGQLPAYEFNLSDVNPPVHAWSCWRIYKMTGPRGRRDTEFLSRVYNKLLINFTWWVNRKDTHGQNVFTGGFLGLDNIGVFDRSRPMSDGRYLAQADATAWMAFYAGTMLSMALELATVDPSYEDIASKFFEHFVAIADAMNTMGGDGLWDQEDGFYYDRLQIDGHSIPMKVRSLVGLLPLIAVEVLDDRVIKKLPGFRKRMEWFLKNRQDLSKRISYMERDTGDGPVGLRLLAIPTREQLETVLKRMLSEDEFLSPHGIRSLSKFHEEHPYKLELDGSESQVSYVPGDSNSYMFGGNSNWRGPIWMPINFLLIEALERYHHYYGDELKAEFPTGSGNLLNLREISRQISCRLERLFLRDKTGKRPIFGNDLRFASMEHWKDLVLFHEFFHGDKGNGLGASHQTGWTSLVTLLIENAAKRREETPA